ncbi:MAG: class I tRNA ligase family protein [Phycisphaerales bacterium]|nr:class I tRNA ligase family protein [Phycisphaerales bacterium]
MFEPLPESFSFPDAESRTLAFWEAHNVFARSLEQRRGAERFVFFEGPPTANGLPHPGHCLTRAIKDVFPRYQTMCGKLVERKAGWDTHGLPVEVEVCKEIGIHSKEEIEQFGVEKFNLRCIQSVFRYTREWEQMTKRLGFWVNLDEAYVTFHQQYVESVWWGLKRLFERGLLYQGHKVVWWWAQGGTALSSGEVGEGYRPVDDPSVYVKFPLVGGAASLGGTGVPPVPSTVEASGGAASLGGTGVPPVRASKRRSIGPELVVRDRYLPHWEAGGSTYFVTFRTRQGNLNEQERAMTLDAIAHFDGARYLLHAAVVMPDHAHAVLTPLARSPGEWWPLAEIMHSIKSYTAHAISQARGGGDVWMEEYFDRIIRSKSDFDEKVSYVLTNPAKRGLPEDYEWVWFEDAHADGRHCSGLTEQDSYGRDARTTQTSGATHTTHTVPSAPAGQETCPTQVSLLVWTTTPWTLLSNQFAAVHPDLEYALVEDPGPEGGSAEFYYVAKELVANIAAKVKRELRVVSTCRGEDLVGLRYLPPFPEIYHARLGDSAARLSAGGEEPIGWRVTRADFVTTDSGTGLVHEAPAFGEVDFDLLQKERQRFKNPDAIPLICAVAPNGDFSNDAPERYRGRWVKDCDKDITRELRDERKTPWGTPLLLHAEQYRHDYPFCPRAENDALIQYARKSWFVRTSQFKEQFLRNNDTINWLPGHIKEGRFGDFLRNNVDWALSRERYWGTPLPIWRCEACGKMDAVGSLSELREKRGATDATPEFPHGYWDGKVAEHAKDNETLPDHLRVHKPYIDAWTYDCECGGGRMRRVPEVIDCWWDAGSMPFAQWGFPHAPGSAATLKERFPANFISEAIDQTRGWFYGLLAINTLLFADEAKNETFPAGAPDAAPAAESPEGAYALPFKTCIVLGHMMGEDGLKMSKRTKNYKEPSYVFDAYGADAMRWYFFSAQTPWTSVRFQEAAIRDAQREFLVRLYNVFSFFTIYANIDGFSAPGGRGAGWRDPSLRSELDRWITSELHRTIRDVRESMDGFENYPSAQRLNDFVDALSNWYVRRSRDRFWQADRDVDKWDAYNTLYESLVALSRLIAPFTPFFAELMHQHLCRPQAFASDAPGTKLSVHLCDYPEANDALIDEALAAEMDLVRDIVSLGRAARTQAKLKVRQPLERVEIALARHEHEEWLQSHAPLIAEELNVRNVEFAMEADEYVRYEVKPNFRALGPKFGKQAPAVGKALQGLADPAGARRDLMANGELAVEIGGQRVILSPDDVEIRLEAREGWSAAQGRAGVVILSTELTPDLVEEGLIREFIHHVQSLRKDLNLPYQARVRLKVEAPAEFGEVLLRRRESVETECLVATLEVGEVGATENGAKEAEIEGWRVRMAAQPV